jgi:hypothetical protein
MGAIREQLAAGQLNAITIAIYTIFSAALAMAGGAAAGVKLAGKDLGNELAASMGAMFGPIGAVPGILLALVILTFI